MRADDAYYDMGMQFKLKSGNDWLWARNLSRDEINERGDERASKHLTRRLSYSVSSV